LPEPDTCGLVYGKDFDGGSSYGCFADEIGAMPTKVPVPLVPPGIKEFRELFCHRVYAGKIWSFVSIAPKARPGEVTERIFASVLLGNDVFYVKRSNNVSFGQVAILT